MTFSAPALALAVAAAAGAVLTALASPEFRPPWAVAAAGAVALAAAAVAPSLGVLAVLVLLVGSVQFRAAGAVSLLRSAGLAAALLGLAALAASGGAREQRLGALAAALAIAAAVGLVPHLAESDDSPAGRVAAAVTAFTMPALAFAIVARTHALLPASSGRVFGGILLAAGCANVLWGLGGALLDDEERLWRGSYIADWGLALIGLGLLSPDGTAAAYLLLVSIVLLRVPLLFRAGGLLTSAALAGAAPFAGFAARLLLLRAATAVAWPLALGVGLALVLWLPASWRLERGPAKRLQLVSLALTLVAGLWPAVALRPVGLG